MCLSYSRICMDRKASRQFYQYVSRELKKIGFTISAVEECMFFKKGTVFVIYVNDGILFIKDPM